LLASKLEKEGIKPLLKIKEEDRQRLLNGEMASEEFFKSNERELSKFLSNLDESLLVGYKEYSNKNMLGMGD